MGNIFINQLDIGKWFFYFCTLFKL